MADSTPVRTVALRPKERGRRPRGCSCDLLVRLCEDEAVGALLGAFGLSGADLGQRQAALHREIRGEPADWQLRLTQRGGTGHTGGWALAELLAVVRSADCHAYRLIERCGVSCVRLRKAVIERIRRQESDSANRPRGSSAHAAPRTEPQRGGRVEGARRPARRRPRGGERCAGSVRVEAARVEAARVEAVRADHSARKNERENLPACGRQSVRACEPARAPAREASAGVAMGPGTPSLRRVEAAQLPPLIGRDGVLAKLADAVMRHTARPPLLVGEHGSGRTLVASHLARVLARDVVRLEATCYGDDEALRVDLRRADEQGAVVIFDDLDRVVGDGCPPFATALSHAWATAEPPVVTPLSFEGRSRLESWMPSASEIFDIVELPQLDKASVQEAVACAGASVLREHGVRFANDANLAELTRLADRWLGGLAMPARALDLLDLACGRAVRRGEQEVGRDTWLEIIEGRTALSRAQILDEDADGVLHLERSLAERVVGHDHVLRTLAEMIRRNRAGFAGQRPMASALLLGPSGVGKTEIAKALSHALYRDESNLLRLDMSEYSEAHSVARIVGAPPGYVGHESGGALVEPLLAQPHRVVLLDEIEKAHRNVHQLLLQVLDEGWLTDGRGRRVDFRHCVLIMTSNLGGELLARDAGARETGVLEAAQAAFPLELWNRIEAPLVLHPLDRRQLGQICALLAQASAQRLARDREIHYSLSAGAADRLVALAGDDVGLGARPLRHLLGRHVESLLARGILEGQVRSGDSVQVVAEGDGFALRRSPQRLEIAARTG
ncbi:MAG: AAA family ATPase [Nannocystaceae bacterium]